jgi:hypothetical protein
MPLNTPRPIQSTATMKRFKRILADALGVLSLLLLVGAVGFWARGYSTEEHAVFEWASRNPDEDGRPQVTTLDVTHAMGCTWFRKIEGPKPAPEPWQYQRSHAPQRPRLPESRWYDHPIYFAGFGYLRQRFMPAVHVIVPDYLAVLITLPPVLLWVGWRFHRPAKLSPGRCRRCGYDLRATPDDAGELLDRCPECGTEVDPITRLWRLRSAAAASRRRQSA